MAACSYKCEGFISHFSVDATIGVAYYPLMASMPQWEMPDTKVEQAHRRVALFLC